MEKLVHRGPDAAGFRELDGAVLGSTRLRIIDLRETADQPISNENGTVHVVFNGEIYNHKQLRDDLVKKGHSFRTETDTEVLVHLYEEHGTDLMHYLRGMFAFALWDEPRRTLLLARDRLGIKPLYYWTEEEALKFASEAKALARNKSLHLDVLDSYLRFGWVAGPTTIYDQVSELPPGSRLLWRHGEGRTERWWEPPHRTSASGRRDFPAEDDLLAAALYDSIRDHLVADVPLGIFLSSGLDSTAVAYLAAKAGSQLETFTVAFQGDSDESVMAASTAGRLSLPHTTIRIMDEEVLDAIPGFISGLDQPTVDGLNTWVVSRAVKEAGMTVALSGLGGDELFEGYSTFRKVPLIAQISRLAYLLPDKIRLRAAKNADRHVGPPSAMRSIEAVLRGGWPASYAAMRAVMPETALSRIMPSCKAGGLSALNFVSGMSSMDTVTQLELRNYLPYQLLRDTDVTSMAHSLEVRVPLLDDRVVEAALSQPVDSEGRTGKARLAAAASPELLPLAARPKQTFTLPFDRWLRGPLKNMARDAIARLGEQDVALDRWELSLLWDEFLEGRTHWRTIWALAVLGMWIDDRLTRSA